MKSSREWMHSTFSPFKHSSFRQFYLAQSLSLMGTWAHDLARAWIIVEMMGKSSALGSMLLATAIPGFLFTLQGGALVDRWDVRKIMTVTKALLALASLFLAIFVEFSTIQMWHLLVYAINEGSIVAFDAPTFQTLIVRMVPREDFQQAIALNSTNFHAARMVGPVVAGTLMHFHGPSLVFLFDAISYLAVIAVLWKLRLPPVERETTIQTPGLTFLVDGLRYVYRDLQLRYLIMQLFLTISVLTPVMTVVFRTYLATVFNLNGAEFGYLAMYPALGSMAGALMFAAFKPKQPVAALRWGVPLAVIAMIMVLYARSALGASLLMGVSGFGIYLCLASMTVSVHLRVQESFRGRVSSLVGLGFISVGPLMSFPVGVLADAIGFKLAVEILTGVFLVSSGILAWLYGKRMSETRLYDDCSV